MNHLLNLPLPLPGSAEADVKVDRAALLLTLLSILLVLFSTSSLNRTTLARPWQVKGERASAAYGKFKDLVRGFFTAAD